MTQTSLQNPTPPPGKKRLHALRFFLALAVAATICFTSFYFSTTPHQRQSIRRDLFHLNSDIGGFLCVTLGIAMFIIATYALVRYLVISVLRTAEIAGVGRISPVSVYGIVAIALGAWGLVMSVLAVIVVGTFHEAVFATNSKISFIAQMLIWLFFVLFNPLALLVAIRYIQARRQLAARLLLIQAAGLVSAGVDPIRALAQVRPHMSYMDARQYAIAEALKRNLTFAQALFQSVPGLTQEDKALLLAGERMGVLGPVLNQKSQEIQRDDKGPMSGFVPSMIVMEWTFLASIVLFVMILIIPKFEKIFDDFGADMPLLTQHLVHVAKYMMGVLPDQMLPGITYILLVFILTPVLITTLPRIKNALGYLAVETQLPWLSDLVVRSNLIRVCFFLSHTLRAGIDLPGALAEARTLGLNTAVNARLLAWENAIRAGVAPGDAAQQAGLPRVMAAFIRAAQNGPAIGDAMDRLARYYQNTTSRTYIVLQSVALPMMVLLTGITVGWIVIALFLPMIKLIQRFT